MRLVAHRYSNSRWFIIFRVIFPFSWISSFWEMLAGSSCCHFLAPLRYWMLWKCWSFSRNLLHLVSRAQCASSSRITENTTGGEFPEYKQQPYSGVQGQGQTRRVRIKLQYCEECERPGYSLVRGWAWEILWVLLALACQEQPRTEDVENCQALAPNP